MAQTAEATDWQRTALEMNENHPGANPKDILGMLDNPDIDLEDVEHVLNGHEGNGTEPETQTESDPESKLEHEDLETLGKKARNVVIYFRENRDNEINDAVDDLDCTKSHIKNTVRACSHLIPDCKLWESYTRPEEITEPGEITADKQRRVVEAIREDPQASQGDIAKAADVYASYVTQTMQVYQHLLPDEWCEKYDIVPPIDESQMDTEPEDDTDGEDAGLDVLFPSENNDTGTEEVEGLDGIFGPDGNLKDPTEKQAQDALGQVVTLVDDGHLDAKDVIDALDMDVVPEEVVGERVNLAYADGEKMAFEDVIYYLESDRTEDVVPDNVKDAIDEFEAAVEADTVLDLESADEEDEVLEADALSEQRSFWINEGRLEALEMSAEVHEDTGSVDRKNFADGIQHAMKVLGIR